MEQPRRSNYGTGVDRIEMIFDGKIYVPGKHPQLLTTKEKYYTSKEIGTYKYLAHDIMFTKIS